MEVNYNNPTDEEQTQESVKQVEYTDNVQEQETTIEQNQEIDFMSMSDDDFEKLNEHTALNKSVPVQETQEEANDNVQDSNAELEQEGEVTNQVPVEVADATSMTPDEFYKAITAPFKANGKMIEVKDPRDIQRLMQKGVNYNEKMASIKPHLRFLKSLENAKLLDENKLSYLIDLANHKPEAIAKLLSDAKIDTYDLPNIDEQPYVAGNNIISESDAEFQDTLETLKKNPESATVFATVETWDESSIQELYANPQLLSILVEQKQTGLFADTLAIIERDKALDKIPKDWNMVKAYDYIGGQLLKAFPERYSQQASVAPTVNQQRQVVGNNLQNPQVVKQAQQSTKVNATLPKGNGNIKHNIVSPVDILSMSDDEFDEYQSLDDLMRKVNFK